MTVRTGGDLGESHRDSFGILLQLIEHRVVAELKHQMKFPFPAEYFNQIDKVRVFEVLQHSYFSECDFLDERIVLALYKLLDGHQVSGVPGPALVHHSVGSLADLAELLVSLHQTRRSPRHRNAH